MQDSSIPASRVISFALWAVVAGFMIAAWLVLFAGEADVAIMIGLTGCVAAATAAVATIRCYSLRLCAVLRIISINQRGQDGGDGRSVRPV